MTETDADIEKRPTFAANRPNDVLKDIALSNLHLLDLPEVIEEYSNSGGSTDFGNVACAVPGILIYLPYCVGGGHSKEWYDEGKTEAAAYCLLTSAKALAGVSFDLILKPELVKRVKDAFRGA